MMKRILLAIAVLGAMTFSAAMLPAMSADAATTVSASVMSDWYKQRARMESSGRMKGKADYRDRPKRGTTEQRLQIQVEKADRNTEYDVLFNGEFLGVLTTNSDGRGKIKFRTAQFNDDRNVHDMPEDFPRVVDGDEIEVGPARGAFFRKD